jgi:hypothetical protein
MAGQVLEIACDESGSDGERLIRDETGVFVHASVHLGTEAAAGCVQEIRHRIRSPAQEYKATHLLREKHRSVLEWLLGSSGPIHGRAHVHLTDKTFFVVRKAVELLVEEVPYTASIGRHQGPLARAMAVTLYREGSRTFGHEQWTAFLRSFVELMRATNRRAAGTSVSSFFHMVDAMHRAAAGGQIHDVMGLLGRARSRVESLRAQLAGSPKTLPALDPLMSAIVQTVAYWSRGGTPVSIVHDQQPSLTASRIAQLEEIAGRSSSGRLTGLRFVDSRSDPRVQIADFLAGAARRIALDELDHRGDAELTALLRPYVDACSTWGDERSWSLLAP